MIEIKIWTHIGHPFVKVDMDTLAQTQADMMQGATSKYYVIWSNGRERTLIINWANVIMLECPSPQALLDAVRAAEETEATR